MPRVQKGGADGSLEPFHIYVGAPEIRDGVHACLWWCTGFTGSFWQGGASPEQAYREAFKTVARAIELVVLNRLQSGQNGLHRKSFRINGLKIFTAIHCAAAAIYNPLPPFKARTDSGA
ncbi:hypothetical protein [Paramagnetospirillum magnetotacticum]|uniref:hypothetical protein n=1 Tax=Paramagnetospirillum magnetotacticum TaxID=188 RepID=UPI0013924900|nr:hypothetical protein [Paramagnetospirillum magnetotacticum]